MTTFSIEADTAAPRITVAGDRALLVEFANTIDAATNARVLALASALRAPSNSLRGLLNIVPAYRSLSVGFNPLVVSEQRVRIHIEECLRTAGSIAAATARRWKVPVCYGGTHGEDLQTLAATHHIDPAKLIELHTAPVYKVYMVGFLPGFAYLGGLLPELHTPRRSMPRAQTPAGSVNIGGQQTAIASVAGPSGWHLIGRTPWPSFDLRHQDPFLFEAGDEVVFVPISPEEFEEQETYYADPQHRPQPASCQETDT